MYLWNWDEVDGRMGQSRMKGIKDIQAGNRMILK